MTHPWGHLLSLQMRVGISLTCRYKLDIVFIILMLYLVKEEKAAERDKIKPKNVCIKTLPCFLTRSSFPPRERPDNVYRQTFANVSLSWRDGHLPLDSDARSYPINTGPLWLNWSKKKKGLKPNDPYWCKTPQQNVKSSERISTVVIKSSVHIMCHFSFHCQTSGHFHPQDKAIDSL